RMVAELCSAVHLGLQRCVAMATDNERCKSTKNDELVAARGIYLPYCTGQLTAIFGIQPHCAAMDDSCSRMGRRGLSLLAKTVAFPDNCQIIRHFDRYLDCVEGQVANYSSRCRVEEWVFSTFIRGSKRFRDDVHSLWRNCPVQPVSPQKSLSDVGA